MTAGFLVAPAADLEADRRRLGHAACIQSPPLCTGGDHGLFLTTLFGVRLNSPLR